MVGADGPDMEGLGELWRKNEPPTLALEGEVRTRARLAVLVVAGEALLVLAAAGAGLWAIGLGGARNLVLGGIALAFAVFALAASWAAHRGRAWAYDGRSMRSQLDSAIAQTQAIRRWARAGYAVAAAAVIFLAVAVFGGGGRPDRADLLIAAGGLAYVGAGVAVSAWLSARQTARLARLNELRAELFDGDAGAPPGP